MKRRCRKPNQRGVERYFLKDSSDFTQDDWVPALLDIDHARTYGEQKAVLGVGFVCVSGFYEGLEQRRDNRAEHRGARFRINDAGLPSLSSVRIGGILVGYQSPDEFTKHPAFAVVDYRRKYHKVISDPSEDLDEVGHVVNRVAMCSLARDIDNYYPGYELLDKLAQEGLELSGC